MKQLSLYKTLFNAIKDCVALYKVVDEGDDFIFVDFNKAAQKAESVRKKDIIGRRVTEVFPMVKDFGLFKVFQEVYRDGTMQHFPFTFYNDGRISGWRDNYIYRLDDEHIIAVYNDVTKEKQAEVDLKLAAKVFDTSLEGILITDRDGVIMKVNQAFCDMSGFDAAEVIGLKVGILKSNIHSEKFYGRMWQMINEKGYWSGEIWDRKKNGESFAVFLNISATYDLDGNVENLIAIYLDITEQKINQDKITHLAYYDTLTGLSNRLHFEKSLEHTLGLAHRKNENVAILFIDLDNFKYVNDSYGHDVGDMLLVKVSKRLKKVVRSVDILARLGGDEFVVVMDGIKRKNEAAELSQRILGQFEKDFELKGFRFSIGCSIGISIYPDDATDKTSLIKYADTAMYQSKSAGKNRFMFHSEDMNAEMERKLILEQEMKEAIKERKFEVFFQPKIVTQSGKVCGAEALIRWRSNRFGQIPPSEFIPFAEENGLIVSIGDFVMETALNKIKELESEGRDLNIAVNISSIQLNEGDFVDKVKNMLDVIGCDPRMLEFEITESKIMSNVEANIRKLSQIKELGITISIDDFGTGYSSMSYLKKLPIDVIKIDKSFIDNIPDDQEGELIVKGIISLAKALSLKVVAEGVETLEQHRFLNTLECDLIQGYLYSKPLNANDFWTFINQ